MNMQPPDSGSPEERPKISLMTYGMFAAFGVIIWYGIGSMLIQSIVSGGPLLSENFALSSRDLMLATATAQIFFILVPTIYLARSHRLGFVEVLRLRPPEPSVWPYAIGLLITGGIVILTVGLLQEVYLAPLLPEVYEAGSAVSDMIEQKLRVGSDIPLLLLGLFVIGIVPAITEELFFRGLIQRSFEEERPPIVALTFTALIFGVVHGQPTNMIGLVALGYLLGYVTWVSRSILPAIVMHMLWNTSQFLILNLTPEGAVSTEEMIGPKELYPLVFLSLAALGLFVLMVRRFDRLR